MGREVLPPRPARPAASAREAAAAGREPAGAFTSLDGEAYYRISSYDRMPPFLMSIPSDSDLWMFVSSAGGLTAGRVDAEGSLFPYETVDKLHDAHRHTGPITLLRVRRGARAPVGWEPFSEAAPEDTPVERNLYKNTIGNRLVFEEIHHGLELAFRYRWSACDAYGWVRTATLANLGPESVSVAVLDGFRNVLPHGAPLALYQQSSSLVDAYKRTDVDSATRLATFSLTSRIVDRPEAAESLRANVVWCEGLDSFEAGLSMETIEEFRRGAKARGERVLTGRRGNYFALAAFRLEPGARAPWHLVADVGRSHVEIEALRARLLEGGDLGGAIETSLAEASESLLRNVASADGLQLTGREEADAHHFANVLFNNMRGGVFANGYVLPAEDLRAFLRTRHRAVADRHAALLRAQPDELPLAVLMRVAERSGDADLERLAHEYLPIYFGRRHGDPSRPWNRFAIRIRDADGTRALQYEGNWRDIFQNWEALSTGFPRYLPNLIAKFVNASTVDGFNPYRITRDGVDWEVIDPHDPWSYIGYWGDHQIVYLLKFLEALRRVAPGALEGLLAREIFCYADVPYRLRPYAALLGDPHTTIDYDTAHAARVAERVAAIGADGKLVPGPDGSIYHVGLLEKLLVPALAKLSNWVPDGGIWMNTQRPEWNDANNALVGNGLSMVTLCYLRRYLAFLERLLEPRGAGTARVSVEVVAWLREVRSILEERRPMLEHEQLDDSSRKQTLDALGQAFSDYRARVYARGFAGKEELPFTEVVALCRAARAHLEHAIRASRREDGLYQAYNILEIARDATGAAVRPLYEMLEGQVATLSSGLLEPAEVVGLLASLFESRLVRADQRSFLLYPERELPPFLERNVVPEERAREVPLVRRLLEAGERSVVARDAFGVLRFHGDFRNAHDLAAALDRLAELDAWAAVVVGDRQALLDLFESVFHHRSFTGRSGTMYGYEGLGCIYWHMVAKLLLAVQENVLRALREAAPAPIVDALGRAYYRIRAGLGYEKTAPEYGAFPTDPYSHTPRHAGAQQPGMTGQVKEEILTRLGELGVEVEDGRVAFRPVLLRRNEFLPEPGTYRFYGLDGAGQSIDVPARALAFSYCQVPVLYHLIADDPWLRVATRAGASSACAGDRLELVLSRALLDRSGEIGRIEVGVPERLLRWA